MTDTLLEGFRSFRRFHYEGDDLLMLRLIEEGQKPEYFVISCIDSRANPATIFRTRPGTLFNFMAMGAIVLPYKQGTALSAALQFALDYGGVRRVVILGHTHCGAIKALAANIEDPEIASFIGAAHEGLERARCACGADHGHEDLLRATEKEIVLQSMRNLETYPAVARALKDGLEVRGWVFDMEAGRILEHTADDWRTAGMDTGPKAADQRSA